MMKSTSVDEQTDGSIGVFTGKRRRAVTPCLKSSEGKAES